ncbi:MAG: glycerol kinase GlpK [Acidimicrobiia bacterium]|nr:glycerol kinase GlpK [Acidimicrobiia bacterium]
MSEFVGALDQGTTSTRFAVIDHSGAIVAMEQLEHAQSFPGPGLVEHDAAEIWANCEAVISGALSTAGLSSTDLAAVGITNQRETTVAWNDEGSPLAPAIVWQDTRTDELSQELAGQEGPDRFRESTGLPLSTYFSAPKMRWLLDNVAAVGAAAARDQVHLGTVDAWLAWNLTGESLTDPTNASRTMLMGLSSLSWEPELCDAFGVPIRALPSIVPSSGSLGECRGVLEGVPLAAILGDQQAALFGQAGFAPGSAKNTYGTGCFLLVNTGSDVVRSASGLLTTVGYHIAGEAPVYALEGSVAIAGAAVQWLRDGLGLIESAPDVERLAASVDDTGDVYMVPAFSGLFAPYWRPDARGVIVGLTRYTTDAHIARATLESTAFQTADVLDAMAQDASIDLSELRVDGGMTANELLMQLQADALGIPVIRPKLAETTVLGAAYAAGLGVGFWRDTDEIGAMWQEDRRWLPRQSESDRERSMARWHQAVERSFGWAT